MEPDVGTGTVVSFWRLSTPPPTRSESVVELAGTSYFEFFTPRDEELGQVRVGEELGSFTYRPKIELKAGSLLSAGLSRVRVTRNEPAEHGMRLVVVTEV